MVRPPVGGLSSDTRPLAPGRATSSLVVRRPSAVSLAPHHLGTPVAGPLVGSPSGSTGLSSSSSMAPPSIPSAPSAGVSALFRARGMVARRAVVVGDGVGPDGSGVAPSGGVVDGLDGLVDVVVDDPSTLSASSSIPSGSGSGVLGVPQGQGPRLVRGGRGLWVAETMGAPSSGPRLGSTWSRSGRGLRGVPQPGAHRGVVGWADREEWLAGVELWLRELCPDGVVRSPVKDDSMRVGKLVRILREVLASADHATGRGADPWRAGVAALLDVAEGTVTRCTRLASRVLGILRAVGHARPLTAAEHVAVRDRGGAQRGLPQQWAAHTPRWLRAYIHRARLEIEAARTRTLVRCPETGELVTAAADGQPLKSALDLAASSQVSGRGSRHVTHPRRGPGATRNHRGDMTHLGRGGAARPRGEGSRKRGRGAAPATTAVERALGAALAAEIASLVPWAAGLRPRAVAAHLAPFAAAGWTASVWVAAVDALYRETGWTRPAVVSSPGGMVYHLCTQLDPASWSPADGETIARPQPCGAPGCELGWRDVLDDAGRTVGAAPCPDCPPVVRSAAWLAETERLAEERAALDAALDAPIRYESREVTKGLLALFDGQVRHHVFDLAHDEAGETLGAGDA